MRYYFLIRNADVEANADHSSDVNSISGWQDLANYFKDEQYQPTSVGLGSGWGPWFATSRDLSWTELSKFGCRKITNGKEMEGKFKEMIQTLGDMYRHWAVLGRGDDHCGTGMETGEKPVNAAMLPMQGGDRAVFLDERHPSILYAWFRLLQRGMWAVTQT